jgi:hypothetical protein
MTTGADPSDGLARGKAGDTFASRAAGAFSAAGGDVAVGCTGS